MKAKPYVGGVFIGLDLSVRRVDRISGDLIRYTLILDSSRHLSDKAPHIRREGEMTHKTWRQWVHREADELDEHEIEVRLKIEQASKWPRFDHTTLTRMVERGLIERDAIGELE